jgi:hypothetical protein
MTGNLFGPMTLQDVLMTYPSTDDRIMVKWNDDAVHVGALVERIEFLEQKLRDTKFYLRQANKGAEHLSHFAKACHMEARVARGQIEQMAGTVERLNAALEGLLPVIRVLHSYFQLEDRGEIVSPEQTLNVVRDMLADADRRSAV